MRAAVKSRGVSLVETTIAVGCVGILAIGGFKLFGSNLSRVATGQGECIRALGCDGAEDGAAGRRGTPLTPSPAAAQTGDVPGAAGAPTNAPASRGPDMGGGSMSTSVRSLLEEATRISGQGPSLTIPLEAGRSLTSLAAGATSPGGLARVALAAVESVVTGPRLWVGGPSSVQHYGTPGEDTIPVYIKQNPIPGSGGGHAHAEVGAPGTEGRHSLSVETAWDLKTFNDGQKWWGKDVATFHMTPQQVETFEKVYKAHTQGHLYRLGDSNLAMHTALIAAGYKDGVGLLYNPPGNPWGYFGYKNDPLTDRYITATVPE